MVIISLAICDAQWNGYTGVSEESLRSWADRGLILEDKDLLERILVFTSV
jgi:hypothetical protein